MSAHKVAPVNYSIFHSLLNGKIVAVYCCPEEYKESVQDELREALPVEAVLVGGSPGQGKHVTYLRCDELARARELSRHGG